MKVRADDKIIDLRHQIKILTAEKTELLRLVKHWKAEAKRYQELYYDINQEEPKKQNWLWGCSKAEK